MPWQYTLVNDIFSKQEMNNCSLSEIIDSDIFEIKKQKCPLMLYKFYTPTIENISDVQNKLLWLSSPETFNDPYDCRLSFDYEAFQQYYTIKSFKSNSIFSDEEKKMIYNASLLRSGFYVDSFSYIFNNMVQNSMKKELISFQHELWEKSMFVKNYIETLLLNKYRIACFSSYSWNSQQNEQLMWAHYAQSHKGFCVEYDISPLFDNAIEDENLFTIYSVDKRDEYLLPSVQRKMMINGFFPIQYSSRKNELSKSLCYAISQNKCTNKQINDLKIKSFRALITKLLPWKYEQEWRLIVDSNISKRTDHKVPFPFIKRIIVGVKASDELHRILSNTAAHLHIPITNEYV